MAHSVSGYVLYVSMWFNTKFIRVAFVSAVAGILEKLGVTLFYSYTSLPNLLSVVGVEKRSGEMCEKYELPCPFLNISNGTKLLIKILYFTLAHNNKKLYLRHT